MKIFKENLMSLGVFCLLLVMTACSKMQIQDDLAGFNPDGDIAYFNVLLQGVGQSSGERILDMGNGILYTLEQASEEPEKVDFITLWSQESGMNLIAPLNIGYLEQWEDGKTANGDWHVKNKTTFVKLDARDSHYQFFASITNAEEVNAAYAWAMEVVADQGVYDIAEHGPGLSVRNLSEGDLIFIETAKEICAVAMVQSINEGVAGSVRLSVKMDRRSHTDVPPLAPSEVIHTYETRVDRPTSSASGLRYLDFATGETYVRTNTNFETGVIYHQEKSDMVFLDLAGNPHFISPDDDESLAWWANSGQWMIDDWRIRNSSNFVKLDASAYADSLFLYSYNNSHIRNAYYNTLAKLETDPDYVAGSGRGPGKYINEISTGDLILFKSESKNIYALAKVTERDPNTSYGGHVELSVKVDNSARIHVPPPPIRVLSGISNEGMVFIDFATMTITPEILAGNAPERYDMAHTNTNVSNHNFMSPSYSFSAYAAALRNRITAWPVRNESLLINLGDDMAYHELYRSLDPNDRQAMEAAWGFAEEIQTPESTGRLTELMEGQIIFVNSVDRGIIAAIRLLMVDNSGPLAIEYKVSQKP